MWRSGIELNYPFWCDRAKGCLSARCRSHFWPNFAASRAEFCQKEPFFRPERPQKSPSLSPITRGPAERECEHLRRRQVGASLALRRRFGPLFGLQEGVILHTQAASRAPSGRRRHLIIILASIYPSESLRSEAPLVWRLQRLLCAEAVLPKGCRTQARAASSSKCRATTTRHCLPRACCVRGPTGAQLAHSRSQILTETCPSGAQTANSTPKCCAQTLALQTAPISTQSQSAAVALQQHRSPKRSPRQQLAQSASALHFRPRVSGSGRSCSAKFGPPASRDTPLASKLASSSLRARQRARLNTGAP